jgi:hypothetical protein
MTARYFASTDAGAPVLNGNNGSLIALLDACLVNGYGSVAITSITQAAGVATVTTTAPHGYGSVPKTSIVIAGATPAAYNGEFDCTITGLNTFTYAVPGGTASPATGTITAKKNGCGWTKAFTATNQAAYKMPAGSNGHYLLVNDAGTANIATIKGCEVAYDATTGLNYFPSPQQNGGVGNLWCFKSATADSTARGWILVCNGPLFHLCIDQDSAQNAGTGMAFGQINSYSTGDAYATLILGGTTAASSAQGMSNIATTVGTTQLQTYLARSYTQLGSSVVVGRFGDAARMSGSAAIGNSGLPYPHGPDGALSISPLYVTEGSPVCVRGLLPGCWAPCHQKPLSHKDYYTGTVGNLAGKTMVAWNLYNACQIFLEVSNTW